MVRRFALENPGHVIGDAVTVIGGVKRGSGDVRRKEAVGRAAQGVVGGQRLDLENVEPGTGKAALLQSLCQLNRVDGVATGCVNKNG